MSCIMLEDIQNLSDRDINDDDDENSTENKN
jgi:hypothetical protein